MICQTYPDSNFQNQCSSRQNPILIDDEDSTDPNEDNSNDMRRDHTYSARPKKSVRKRKKYCQKSKVGNTKDLRKKEEIINKRYNSKIEQLDEMFKCRACLSEFPSKILARIHVNQPICSEKKKRNKTDKLKCNYPECNKVFFKPNDCRKHKRQCHSDSYVCPECKSKIKSQTNYIRHLKECKKIANVYNCSKCNFVSFCKDTLQTHNIEH